MGGRGKIEPRWKKGETGNPNGRPKKLPALDLIMANVMGWLTSWDRKKTVSRQPRPLS